MLPAVAEKGSASLWLVDEQYCDQPGRFYKHEIKINPIQVGQQQDGAVCLLLIHYIRAGRQTAGRLAEPLLFHCADADRESSLKFT